MPSSVDDSKTKACSRAAIASMQAKHPSCPFHAGDAQKQTVTSKTFAAVLRSSDGKRDTSLTLSSSPPILGHGQTNKRQRDGIGEPSDTGGEESRRVLQVVAGAYAERELLVAEAEVREAEVFDAALDAFEAAKEHA